MAYTKSVSKLQNFRDIAIRIIEILLFHGQFLGKSLRLPRILRIFSQIERLNLQTERYMRERKIYKLSEDKSAAFVDEVTATL